MLLLLLGAFAHLGGDHITNPTWPPGGEIDADSLDDQLCYEDCETYYIYSGPTPCDPPGCNEDDYTTIEERCNLLCD